MEASVIVRSGKVVAEAMLGVGTTTCVEECVVEVVDEVAGVGSRGEGTTPVDMEELLAPSASPK